MDCQIKSGNDGGTEHRKFAGSFFGARRRAFSAQYVWIPDQRAADAALVRNDGRSVFRHPGQTQCEQGSGRHRPGGFPVARPHAGALRPRVSRCSPGVTMEGDAASHRLSGMTGLSGFLSSLRRQGSSNLPSGRCSLLRAEWIAGSRSCRLYGRQGCEPLGGRFFETHASVRLGRRVEPDEGPVRVRR